MTMNKFELTKDIYTIGVRETDNLDEIKESLRVNELLFMNQIHGADILDCTNKDNLELLFSGNANVDGVFFKKNQISNVGVVVKTADCIPIFILGADYYIAIHAGWKGLALGIHLKISEFLSSTELKNAKVVIGPHAINGYEVKSDVLDQFRNPIFKEEDKTFLNMQETLLHELLTLGINKSNIQLTDTCTISNTRLYSYRRNNTEKKRNFNILSIK